MCFICGVLVPVFASVLWCDGCMDEFLRLHREQGMPMDEFIAAKRVRA